MAHGVAKQTAGGDTAGFVLAGGRSSRMGRDKARLEFRGQPLVVHALDILRAAGLEPSISAASGMVGGGGSALAEFAPVVGDVAQGAGPLGGICAAMAATTARWSVFIPVDQPLLPASLLQYLLDRARSTRNALTVTSVTSIAETFPVILERSALPWLQSELDAGHGGCFSAFHAAAVGLGQQVKIVAVETLAGSGEVTHPNGLPVENWFLNINTVDDLHRAEELCRGIVA